MVLPLRDDFRRFVEQQVSEGRYASAQEVIEAGLARLMLDPADDRLDEATLAAIEEARAQLARGEGISLDEGFERLRRKHLGK